MVPIIITWNDQSLGMVQRGLGFFQQVQIKSAYISLRLEKQGLGILVWDAYRPRRATLEMATWAEENKIWLLEEGYLVYRSRHNAGGAIDLNMNSKQVKHST